MSEQALALTRLDPSMVKPGFADEFLPAIVAIDDLSVLWNEATTCDALVQKWVGHAQAQEEAGYLQIYCEIQLGELLGPPAGRGGDRKSNGYESKRNSALIPHQTESELRDFHGYRDRLYPAIQDDRKLPRKERKLDSRHAARMKARAWRSNEVLLAARERAIATALPAGVLLLEQADARAMPLDDDSVDLIVTSPPYGLDVAYSDGDVEAGAWPAFMADWLREAYRVTKPSGRLALNVPLDTSEPTYRATYAEMVVAAVVAGWEYRSTVIWADGQTTKGGWALGSQASAARPHHVSQVETIGLFSKGEWAPSSTNPDDITREQFMEAGRGPWTFSGESRAWEGHPAPFPLELPRRLIRYLCRVGDVVLDPFVGSGTTLVAAIQLKRQVIGFDVSDEYIESARRRVAGGGTG